MKALQLSETKELAIVDVSRPVLKEGEVLVKIKAAAINHRELWIAKGLYPGMTLPCILGADGAGIVEEVHCEKESEWKGKEVIIYPAYDWGDNEMVPLKQFRVLGMPEPGTMAEYIAMPATHLVEKPTYLSWEEAAAIPVAYLTAWRSLTTHGQIRRDKSVLVTGIGGGVAQAGLAFALAFGCRVFVTSGSSSKIHDAIGRGAEGGVNYKEKNWNEELKSLSGGVDLVLDSSPAENLDDYLRFLNTGAKIVAYGSTGNRKTTLNISKFFLRHIQFIGTAMGSLLEFKSMLSFMEEHQLMPRVHKAYTFDYSLEAFDELAKGKQMGKIVLTMD